MHKYRTVLSYQKRWAQLPSFLPPCKVEKISCVVPLRFTKACHEEPLIPSSCQFSNLQRLAPACELIPHSSREWNPFLLPSLLQRTSGPKTCLAVPDAVHSPWRVSASFELQYIILLQTAQSGLTSQTSQPLTGCMILEAGFRKCTCLFASGPAFCHWPSSP